MSDEIEIRLTWHEMLLAAQAGCLRQVCALQDQRRARYGVRDGEAWQDHVIGALGEYAVAKAMRAFWTVGSFRAPDVGRYEVRTTPYQSGALLLHADDRDDAPYVLVTGGCSAIFVVRGWLLGRDVKQPSRWGTRDGKLYQPAYVAEQHELRPLRELLYSRRASDARTKESA